MRCPSCAIGIEVTWKNPVEVRLCSQLRALRHGNCPVCGQLLIDLGLPGGPAGKTIIWPNTKARPLPPEVQEPYASEFRQACEVLALSPMASAALSRRILQSVIRNICQIKKPTLDQEIAELLSRKVLSSSLAGTVDAIRNFGNFAAHEQKHQVTGELLKVEDGEAEFCLDLLEQLFDELIVRPATSKAAIDKANAKLLAAGKPLIKQG